MIYAYFGNPLNKAKKNEWVENQAVKWMGTSMPLPYYRDIAEKRRTGLISPMDSVNGRLRRLHRTTEKEQNEGIGSQAARKSYDKLQAIKNKDYTDVRYDDASGQYVGFPKVNGYMEVPLPPGKAPSGFLYDLPEQQQQYIFNKEMIMTPQRESKPRGAYI